MAIYCRTLNLTPTIAQAHNYRETLLAVAKMLCLDSFSIVQHLIDNFELLVPAVPVYL
jgi:hypothetical protein